MKSIDDAIINSYVGKLITDINELIPGNYIFYTKAIWECTEVDYYAAFCMYAYADSMRINYKDYIADKNRTWNYRTFSDRQDMFHVNDAFLTSDLVTKNHYITNAILRGTL